MTLVHASVRSTNDSTLNRQRVGESKTSCGVSKNIHSEEMELTQADKVITESLEKGSAVQTFTVFFPDFAPRTIQSAETSKGKKLLQLVVVMLKS